MMVEINDLIISIDLHAVMVLFLCSCNAGLQLFNIFNLYFYWIKLSVKLINYWLLILYSTDCHFTEENGKIW